MTERIIEIEAASVAEACRAVRAGDVIVLEETVLRPDRAGTVECVADTTREASARAGGEIPAEALLVSHKIIAEPRRVSLRLKGDDEASVLREVNPKATEVIESISLHKKGRKGFLGFFRRPHVYDVSVFQQAVVEVKFNVTARVRARVRDYRAIDLLQSIEEARQRNARWEEAAPLLNPKNDGKVQKWLDALEESESYEMPEPLLMLETACRAQEAGNWEAVINRAYEKVAAARAQLWIELRGLDAELADIMSLYTSIHWFEKSGDPKGIPTWTRPRWGRQGPDERFREKIPCYSTDKGAFSTLERKLQVIGGLKGFYESCLREEGLDEETAPLRRKCEALLRARKTHLRERGKRP
jgi:hypothetical protein